jgi:membrane protease YdiL (CAAX protease family)
MLNEAISAVLQIGVVVTVALVLWAIFARKKESFARYVGLIAPTPKAMLWTLGVAIVVVPATLAVFMLPAVREMAAGGNTVAGQMREQGLSADVLGQIVIVALFKTALSEEIFFRGLIAKRLIRWLGFGVGNTLHAVLFGAIHLLIFAIPGGPKFDPVLALVIAGLPGISGWIMAWLNERVGNGSIAPGWFLHATGNALAYPLLAFG